MSNRQTPARSWRWLLLYLVLASCFGGLYLGWAMGSGVSGFPLDDGWIHQTYARNLAFTGRWEYVPGQVSAGSTSPLWTALLAAGYWLGVPFMVWTMGLGVIALALTAWAAHRLSESLFPVQRWIGPAAGLLCVGEWHLVWAAVSGMETALYAALALALTCMTVSRFAGLDHWSPRDSWGLGVLAGLLVLTRPEGVLLIGLSGLWVIARVVKHRVGMRQTVEAAGAALAPFLLLMVPYLVFNWRSSGRIWPNTFYAKQTEYAVQLAWPIWTRFWRVLLPALAGPQLLLVPGIILAVARAVRSGLRRPSNIGSGWLPVAYAALHLSLYALRLPVSYQHGRYLMPAIPFLIVGGLGGLLPGLALQHSSMPVRILGRAWAAAGVVLVISFLIIGARAYQRDVTVIDHEMVAVARWLRENTEPDDLIAAHDIGAIGYYAQRPILDLAGLISPEVIPMLGDPAALSEYVLGSGAGYLVTAPGWPYESLTERSDVRLVYSAESEETVKAGLNPSAVYRLPVSDR